MNEVTSRARRAVGGVVQVRPLVRRRRQLAGAAYADGVMDRAPGVPRGCRVGDLKTAVRCVRGAEPRLGALDLPPGTPGGRPVAVAAVNRAFARAEPG